jgi:L-2-hydroxyglutarate oxidase
LIFDYIIVGGGIVGLATAKAIYEFESDASILLLEKESSLASHQTGHNSGVIHSGIYYPAASLKSKLCKEGLISTKNFCSEHKIPFENCGKLIVATNLLEENRLVELYNKSKLNHPNISLINSDLLKSMEPSINGNLAIYSPDTGIVDYRKVAIKIAELVQENGLIIQLNTTVNRINEQSNLVEIGNDHENWQAKKIIVCGGLQADRLARLAGLKIDFRIVPFKGEYFKLPSCKNSIIKHLIYPVPDPMLPFLGIHLTRMIDGGITVGPNATISFSREKYSKMAVNLKDISSYLAFPGFWKLTLKHRAHVLHEIKTSFFKNLYLRDCQKYYPDLKMEDLLPYKPGIRAQLVHSSGLMENDFLFRKTNRMLHVLNAPSPAATSAFPIGRIIAEHVIN